MGNDIGSGVSFKSVCFDFFSTNVGISVIGTRTSNGFDDITLYIITYLTVAFKKVGQRLQISFGLKQSNQITRYYFFVSFYVCI